MLVPLILLVGCVVPPTETSPFEATHDLPGHNDCLPEGQAMDAETCAAVLEEDGRMATQASYKADVPTPDPDPRVEDPEYAWLKAQAQRCTCSCCHTGSFGGPGLHKWDLAFEDPFWIDSANDWSLQVLAGYVEEGSNQVLPIEDLERARSVLGAELERRAGHTD